ncbi:MAG: metallophosphoesterase [Bacteroidetes bacterium]|nr:metallophosphoesterase [Bacteroidota bacterium]
MFAVIGDIHGCVNTLRSLHTRVKETYEDIEFYCTGDLVDRGNYSPEVLDFVMEENIHPVLGNHDRMFFSYFTSPDSSPANLWIYNSSSKTLYDYEHNPGRLVDHLEFVGSLPLFYDLPRHIISHAGIGKHWLSILDNSGNIDVQKLNQLAIDNIDNENGLLWNRAELLKTNKIQIVGHTPVPNFKYYKNQRAYYIDTGAAAGNKLTALIFGEGDEADIIFERTDKRDFSSTFFR